MFPDKKDHEYLRKYNHQLVAVDDAGRIVAINTNKDLVQLCEDAEKITKSFDWIYVDLPEKTEIKK